MKLRRNSGDRELVDHPKRTLRAQATGEERRCKPTIHEARSEAVQILIFFILFFLGIVFLFCRNPNQLLNPIVYAEDGIWTGLGLTKGWLYTLIHARPDYFVIINVFLLFLSTKISAIVTGSPLLFLPESIALVSYAFYAAVATFVFFTLRRVGSVAFAILGFFLIIWLPLGKSQDEVIGRILQVGFYMPLLAVMFIFWRDRLKWKYGKFLTDFLLLACAATNPVVFLLVFIYVIYDFSKDYNVLSSIKRISTLIFPFAIVATFLFPRMKGGGGVPGELVRANLVEAVIARPILYPYVFPEYSRLNNTISIVLVLLLFVLVWLGYRKSRSNEAKYLILFTALSLLIYDLTAVINRPGLTGFLAGYQSTYPDRYYMGVNVLAVLLVVACVSQLFEVRKYRVFGSVMGIAMCALYIFYAMFKVMPKRIDMPIKPFFDFAELMCLSDPAWEANGNSKIQIYPDMPNWRMTVPSKYIDKKACKFTSYSDIGFTGTGTSEGYKMQPSEPLGASASIKILMTSAHQKQNVGLKRIGVIFGTYGRRNAGEGELRLKGPEGSEFTQRFSLPDILDNKYHYFDLDSKRYTSGEIIAISGGGISTWESHSADGVYTCMNYQYSDGSRRFTPGCPPW